VAADSDSGYTHQLFGVNQKVEGIEEGGFYQISKKDYF
jgi:hypothetical protein